MEIKGLGFIPLFSAFWCVAYLSTSFTLTIIHGRAPPLMFISNMGSLFAEHIFLGIGYVGMSITALGQAFLIYKFMKFHPEAFRTRHPWIQKILLAIVWSSCILTAVMAIFARQYPMIHRVTAFVSFLSSGVYNLWQATLFYKVPGTSRVICHVRTAFCAMTLTCLFLFIGSRVLVYTNLCDGGYEEICEAFAKVIEWSTLVFKLFTYVTYYATMQSLMLTISWNSCTISLRVKINDFGV